MTGTSSPQPLTLADSVSIQSSHLSQELTEAISRLSSSLAGFSASNLTTLLQGPFNAQPEVDLNTVCAQVVQTFATQRYQEELVLPCGQVRAVPDGLEGGKLLTGKDSAWFRSPSSLGG